MHSAVLTNNIKRVALLLESRSAEVHVLESAWYAPILFIEDCKELDMLIYYGADVNTCTSEGRRDLS